MNEVERKIKDLTNDVKSLDIWVDDYTRYTYYAVSGGVLMRCTVTNGWERVMS
jgi:hypothetical protein